MRLQRLELRVPADFVGKVDAVRGTVSRNQAVIDLLQRALAMGEPERETPLSDRLPTLQTRREVIRKPRPDDATKAGARLGLKR